MTTIVPGCVFHWKRHEFADGETADKYFVILGAKKDYNVLAVIATSKSRGKKFDPGCHAIDGYYHIPGGGKDWFPKDTWLLLGNPLELSLAEFLKLGLQKSVTLSGNLRQDIANAIRNCLKGSPDASANIVALL